MDPSECRVVMLVGPSQSSRIMYHGISSYVDIICVIREDKEHALTIVKRRLKRLGFSRVTGQLLFAILNTVLRRISRRRVRELLARYRLMDDQFPSGLLRQVGSVNNEEVVTLLRELKPDVVVVNGTRIISKEVLASTDGPFINTHMGITPKYRGVHGGYWALTQNDRDNCGVTVHLVDKGIDTGGILYQDTIEVESFDDLNTYPIHQIAKAIPLMRNALNDISNGNITIKTSTTASKLWYHPTLFEYLKHRLIIGVK